MNTRMMWLGGLLLSLGLGCGEAAEAHGSELTTADEKQPTLTLSGANLSRTYWECREVGTVWEPGEPLRLPCERTEEPCDGVDNDRDGITDPHCPTFTCRGNADCTYGLLLDADCNGRADPPVCNQIDGSTDDRLGGTTHDCWGVLCPPGEKCVQGRCLVPEEITPALPDAPCFSGAQCPINAGCIPANGAVTTEDAVCRYFCHDVDCPEGYACLTGTTLSASGHPFVASTCLGVFGCREGALAAADLVPELAAAPGSLTACLMEQCAEQSTRGECVFACEAAAVTPLEQEVMARVRSACGKD